MCTCGLSLKAAAAAAAGPWRACRSTRTAPVARFPSKPAAVHGADGDVTKYSQLGRSGGGDRAHTFIWRLRPRAMGINSDAAAAGAMTKMGACSIEGFAVCV